MALTQIFDPELTVKGWFDETAVVEGWFDPDFTETPGGGSSKTLTDTGTAVDALGGITVTAALSDARTGTDAVTVTVSVPTQADTGSGVDTFGVTATVPLADPRTGTDAVTVTATSSLADTGQGADTLTVTAVVTVADTGTGTDAITASASGTNVTLPAETGTGTDAVTVTVTVTLDDTGTFIDSVTVTTPAAATYLFKPPTDWDGYGMGARLVGRSVWRKGGVWFERHAPSDIELDGADPIYMGGHEYPIDQAAYDDLVAAGYSPEVVS